MYRFFKILEKMLYIICFITTIVGVFIIYCSVSRDENNLVHFNNLYFVEVNDNNMSPDIKKNDVVLISKDNTSNYHINNAIAYLTSDVDGDIDVKIAKIVDGYSNDNKDSYIFMVQQNNSSEQENISGDLILGRWNGNKITNGVNIFGFILSRLGFIVITIVPFIILFLVEFILLIFDYKNRYLIN